MEKLIIEGTNKTPAINFDPDTGVFGIEGRSIPEDPETYYDAVFTWLEEYFLNPKEVTTLNLTLEYINSGSSKCLMAVIKIINKYFNEGNNCIINWFFEEEDESIEELGEYYQSIVTVPINLKEY